MKAGTLFSGIGAPECAAPWIDWRWCAEIEPFPSAVHAARFPGIPNLGDVTEVDWHAVEPVDLVVAGPPCQDHSIAGNRAGLGGERGELSLATVDILDAVDPVWSVTENVPGWLSLDDNAFGHFLGRLVGADAPLVPGRGQRWTDAGVVAGPRRAAAWRTLDAQYFGVAQRRRRVFVLARRGAGERECADALFPVVQSLRRDTPPRRQAGEGVARPIASGVERGSGYRNDADTADNLIAQIADPISANEGKTYTHEGSTFRLHNCVARSLNAHPSRIDGESETFIAYDIHGTRATNGASRTDIHTALRSRMPGQSEASTTTVVCGALQSGGTPNGHGTAGINQQAVNAGHIVPVAFHENVRGEVITSDMAYGLKTGGGKPGQGYPAVAINISDGEPRLDTVAGVLAAESGSCQNNYDAMQAMSVRRLTPRECERLQDFPPEWTAIPYRGKPAADGPRYRALGNSMAVPVVRWLLARVRQADTAADMAEAAE